VTAVKSRQTARPRYREAVPAPDVTDSPPAIEGATEWFPPPRFLLVEETSQLYIVSVSARTRHLPGQGFEPLTDYIEERAGRFVAGFRRQ
jgi:hypothetical protein